MIGTSQATGCAAADASRVHRDDVEPFAQRRARRSARRRRRTPPRRPPGRRGCRRACPRDAAGRRPADARRPGRCARRAAWTSRAAPGGSRRGRRPIPRTAPSRRTAMVGGRPSVLALRLRLRRPRAGARREQEGSGQHQRTREVTHRHGLLQPGRRRDEMALCESMRARPRRPDRRSSCRACAVKVSDAAPSASSSPPSTHRPPSRGPPGPPPEPSRTASHRSAQPVVSPAGPATAPEPGCLFGCERARLERDDLGRLGVRHRGQRDEPIPHRPAEDRVGHHVVRRDRARRQAVVGSRPTHASTVDGRFSASGVAPK